MSSLYFEQYAPTAGQEDSQKPLLLLVHGGALSHRFYKDMTPVLTGYGYNVVAPDLPGHGQSKAAGPFTFDRATDLLQATIAEIKTKHNDIAVVLVGVSLGGQVVLDIVQKHPHIIESAVVSGVSIHPPNEKAQWEMPHMTDDETWNSIITEDVQQMGMDNAAGIQQESFSFQFEPPSALPPVLVVVGEHDTAMARRDHEELGRLLKASNSKSQALVMNGAWHNHPIDVPEEFAKVIKDWLDSQKATYR